MNPSIVIVAPGHADTLTDEFGRYARDYDVRTTTSVGEAEEVARSIVGTGGQVAMFVSESRLPGGDVVDAFTRWPPPSPRPRSRRCGSSPRAAMRWPRASATSWTAWACRTAPTPPTPTRVEP